MSEGDLDWTGGCIMALISSSAGPGRNGGRLELVTIVAGFKGLRRVRVRVGDAFCVGLGLVLLLFRGGGISDRGSVLEGDTSSEELGD